MALEWTLKRLLMRDFPGSTYLDLRAPLIVIVVLRAVGLVCRKLGPR
jgi:hypothetical protein